MNIPNEPLERTWKNRPSKGYVYVTTADGKRRQKYFKGEYKSREMWDDFLAWKIKQTGGQPSTRTPALESLRSADDARTAATVYEVVANHLFEVKERRCKGTKADQAAITLTKRSLLLLAPYDDMLADDINGTHMQEIQRMQIASTNNSRKTINTKISVIADAFESAYLKSLVTEATVSIVRMWERKNRLRSSDSHVPGPRAVHAVDEAAVHKTIAAASPLLATMIICQFYTGMRSTNLCELRWADIDQSMYKTDGVWLYSPVDHKTKRLGKELPIYFGPQAITALLDYEKVRPDQGHPYIFNPRAGWCYPQFAKQQTTTKTPKGAAAKILKLLKAGPASTKRIQRIKRHFNNEITYLRRLGHDIERVTRKTARNNARYTLMSVEPHAEENLAALIAEVGPGNLCQKNKQYRNCPSTGTLKVLDAVRQGPKTSRDLSPLVGNLGNSMQMLRNLGFRIQRQRTDLDRGDSLFLWHGYTRPETETKPWSYYYDRSTKTDLNPCYSKDTYAKAIARVINQTGQAHWHPHQLRHAHTTKVRHAKGIEAAQAVIGHSSKAMTERYSEKNHALARKTQKVLG